MNRKDSYYMESHYLLQQPPGLWKVLCFGSIRADMLVFTLNSFVNALKSPVRTLKVLVPRIFRHPMVGLNISRGQSFPIRTITCRTACIFWLNPGCFFLPLRMFIRR
uniref:Uncharacterized protein n=1 Tax=Cacopsylla melanoneura TaxID=428564 RepID=A0A8D9BZK7_9HEMI